MAVVVVGNFYNMKIKKDWIYWLRWIILFPVAFIIGFITLFFLYWLIYLVFVDGNICSEASIQSFIDTFSPAIMTIIMVSIGYLIAPEHKLKTCIILALLLIIAFIIF